MMHRYTPADIGHFGRMWWRGWRRQRAWGRRYEASIRDGTYQLPAAAVVQLIPTEACNLRCPMCNQWGENGYFLSGAREVTHMDPDALSLLVHGLSPADSLISVHGGEPFAYKHMDVLLALLSERPFDVIFSTNGTLMERHLDGLARIRNLALLLSIDGDEAAHDRIRGEGSFRRAREGLAALFASRRRAGQPRPLVVMSFVVCEWNADVIERAYQVAQDLGVLALNYNMRWFLRQEIGLAYERHLEQEFGVRSSGAWRGWVSNHPDHDYHGAAAALRQVLRRQRRRLLPPYVVTTPSQLRGDDFETYFSDYLNVFGNESCFMPFYWARVHANGDLIYCPGHPDIIAGNVFRDGFLAAFNSEVSVKFRRYILGNRLPICNRCCGLYMTNPARPVEQGARRRLGLDRRVTAHFP
jgi:MoaA/NifB/PqqE/SkfB family radical SAM enzyme